MGDTALHSGKDFAVSLLYFYRIIPVHSFEWGTPHLSMLGVSVRTSAIARDGNYPLPLNECSDFPPGSVLRDGQLSDTGRCILTANKNVV